MDSNSDDLNVEEDGSEAQPPSNNSEYSDSENLLSENSGEFIQPTSSSSSNSISEETYTRRLTDHVRELKAELQAQCHLDWFNKFEPSKHNPKIELNLLLHGAIREQTLRQLTLTKAIPFSNDEQMIADIFQNDPCLLQRILQEIVNDQRQQRIIYTEILFRPDVFNFGNEMSNIKLKNVMASDFDIIIECIRSLTLNDTANNGKTTMKMLLSCNWNSVKMMPQFIRLTRDYPQEIVGIDFYGQEDDCRKYWHEFHKYTEILHHYHIRCQASMPDYKDLQLMAEVIKDLGIERLSEAYEMVLSSDYLEDILIKHGIHLVLCPTSNAYNTANHRIDDIFSETGKKRKYQSTSSLDNVIDENNSSQIIPYNLINHLQSELLNYSISSLSPTEYQENLSSIYKNLFEKNKNLFTCEHMQWLNENTIKSSFAPQKLKTELMTYIRENYSDCYKQTILIEQFQATTHKWQQEMNEIIDRNARIAVEFAKKMRKEKLLKRFNHQREKQTKLFNEEESEHDQVE